MKKHCLWNSTGGNCLWNSTGGNCLWNSTGGNGSPPKFPCIPDDRIGADENGYAVYYTEADIRRMLDAVTAKPKGQGRDFLVRLDQGN
jgi:hypothetical protein